MTFGVALFVSAIVLVKYIERAQWENARAWGLFLIVGASIVMIVCTTPLAYFITMKSTAKPRSAGTERKNPALRLFGSKFGELMFALASRNLTAAPPRNATAALDQLLSEVEAAVPAANRPQLRQLRDRLNKLTAEAHALRMREKDLDRAMAEAGPGAAADRIEAARGEIAPRIEKIAAATDEARLKLLLVRTGVAPASELGSLAEGGT
jgi:hypothetical protein